MAGIAPVKVDYKSASTNITVRSMGGIADGHVTVDDNNGPRIAQPVLNDIDNGIAEKPNEESYKNLEIWSENDRTEYEYDAYAEKNETGRTEAKNDVKNSDGESVTSIEGQGPGQGGSIVTGAVASAGLAAAVGVAATGSLSMVTTTTTTFSLSVSSLGQAAEVSRETHTAPADVPFGGAVGTGIICLAGGAALLLLAGLYDKDGLKQRQSFANAVPDYIANATNQADKIDAEYDRILEDRASRYSDVTDVLVKDSEEWLAKLEEMQDTLQKMIDEGATEEEINEYRQQINDFIEGDPVGDELDQLGEIENEGYDEFYNLLNRAQGTIQGYDIVAQFLEQGKQLGAWATAIAALDLVVAAFMTTLCVRMIKSAAVVPDPTPLQIVRTTAVSFATGSCIMVGIGAASALAAAGWMTAKAVKEFKCAAKGGQLRNEAMAPLTAKILEKSDIDSVVQTQINDLYSQAEGVVADIATGGENAGEGGDGDGNGGDGGSGGGDGGGNTGGGGAE